MKAILGIETSCDETSAAVIVDGKLRSNIISTQVIHQKYGGVVPELASRAHQTMIVPVVRESLEHAKIDKENLSAISAATGPGLMGSLLVGVNFAKSMAYGLGIPFIGVNHMEAHIYSNFIEDPVPEFPFLNLTVSGGHTQLVLVSDDFQFEILGETLDDAAGEAFDKVAKMLGLPYPGGPLIDTKAKLGNPEAIQFPRPFSQESDLNFSFSGIKTSVLYYLRDHGYREGKHTTTIPEPLLNDICASFQRSVVDVLVHKTEIAAKQHGIQRIAIAGGVSANSLLRSLMKAMCTSNGWELYIPKLEYCTDNGGMIAEVGYRKFLRGDISALTITADPNLALSP